MSANATNRVALISGASRGIGDYVAAELLQQGWAVSLAMRTPARPAWAAGHDERVHLIDYDAKDVEAESRWVDSALHRFGRIDAIIANAGIMIPKTVIEADEDDIEAMLSVNVKAPRRLAKAAWSAL
ncbi:short subunit dehydrogenase [Rhizobium sp. PP-F2F-G36]|nr:short subunit dehydrogenase [Rhizobium sp. PP-F2F-G36]